ncbi:proline-rich protein 5 [Garra rufa]|uniref:proline-rich protein 5 n=1 Tax=Garra rufa TaxID=137080 RepID=UPI003CCE899B
MLLILQGVHESKGVTNDYLKLESLVQKVVSPYLGTHGLFSGDGSVAQSSCVLEKRLLRRWPRTSDSPAKNLVVRSKSYNIPMLTPVAEYDPESVAAAGAGIRRHSVCQMTSCAEEPAFTEAPPSPLTDVCEDPVRGAPSPLLFPELGSSSGGRRTERDSSSSSPETIVDQILESLDSDTEGIFIDFRRRRSSSSDFSRESESAA